MNRDDLLRKFHELGIPDNAYSLFGGLPSECFCLNRGELWEVYYSERGQKSLLGKFQTEEEACDCLFSSMMGDQALLACIQKTGGQDR